MPTALPVALVLAGAGLGALVVRLCVPLQSRSERQLLGSWYEWALPAASKPRHEALLIVALVLLAMTWLGIAGLVYARPHVGRWTSRLAVVWAAPFALSPPFQSKDVYAYVAQGALLHRGTDPYTSGPRALGPHDVLLQAVDPRWRSAGSPYGPVALRLSEAATAVGGHGVGSLVVLRVLAVLSILAVVLLLRVAAPAGRADLATWLALSPLVLIQLIAAMHWEAEVAALLVAALVLARRAHPGAALLLALLAAEIKASALVVVAVLVVQTIRRLGMRGLRQVVGAAVVALGVAYAALPHDPWGWAPNLRGTAASWSPFAPATTLYLVLGHLHLGPADLLAACRVVTAVLGGLLALRVLRQREADLAARASVLTLAAVIALPTVWPWYVAPAALLMLLSRPRLWWFGAVLALTSSLASLPIGTYHAQRTMVAAEAVALLGGAAAVLWSRRSRLP